MGLVVSTASPRKINPSVIRVHLGCGDWRACSAMTLAGVVALIDRAQLIPGALRGVPSYR
jgi:hypothetical protein